MHKHYDNNKNRIPQSQRVPITIYRDQDTTIRFGQILGCRKCNISYNTGTRALPDIYALALGRAARGHRAYISDKALLPVL